MNGYTILSSHRERNRIKEDKREIGMNNIFVLGDRIESSSIYIIYNIGGMGDKIDPCTIRGG